jgi:2-methylcitrate dehydratase PrpD
MTEPSLTQTLAEWAVDLEYERLPAQVAAYAVSQFMSHIATIRAGMAHPIGRKLITAFGPPLATDPDRSAYLLAALSSCLYYEDSMYTGHVSHSAVGVPLAYRRAQRLDGRRCLAAMVAASECAARVTAAAALGPLRGQSASFTHLVGAVAARLHGAGAPARQWVAAWGLALAAPPLPLRRAFVGSDAKVLSASAPVRVALDACDAATAGLGGAEDILEHPGGLLAQFAEVASPEVITAGLGRRWHTETLSFKVHPASAFVDAAIDCAIELHSQLTAREIASIDEITVYAPRVTITMDHAGAPYLNRERSAIMALNLSVAYNIATALVTGSVRPEDLAEPATADPVRWGLADKVRLEHDPELSRNFLCATAPLGEALRQAGDRAAKWLEDFSGQEMRPGLLPQGPPSATFEGATKAIGSSVRIVMRDGRRLGCARAQAAGSAGARTRLSHRDIARGKLLATGVRPDLADALSAVASLSDQDLDDLVAAVLHAC